MNNCDDASIVALSDDQGNEYQVLERHALLSETLKNVMEDGAFGTIPLPNVSGFILKKVFEYTALLEQNPVPSDRKNSNLTLYAWETAFLESIPHDNHMELIIDLIKAANFLDMKPLLDLATRYPALIIRKQPSADAIRETFDIEDDFAPGEREAIEKQNIWKD